MTEKTKYTPTTEKILEAYLMHWNGRVSFPELIDEFNNFLSARDAEVRADEREKAAQRVLALRDPNHFPNYMFGGKPFPYLVGLSEAIAAARGSEQNV